jgi:hypothetical protein
MFTDIRALGWCVVLGLVSHTNSVGAAHIPPVPRHQHALDAVAPALGSGQGSEGHVRGRSSALDGIFLPPDRKEICRYA